MRSTIYGLRFAVVVAAFAFFARPALADVTNVEIRVTYTNLVAGVTNGHEINVHGSIRRYTNGVLNSASLWIQSTNIVGHAATNTQIHLATYGVSGIDRVFATNTNAIIIVSALGVFPTVTLSSGVGTVTYATNVWAEQTPLLYPNAAGYSEAERTNNASGLIDLINDVRPTNRIANGLVAWTNIVDLMSQQRGSNKVWWATTNTGGLSDGTRLTNFTSLSGSNGTVSDMSILRGSALNLTNLSGTNWLGTNVTLRHFKMIDGRPEGTNAGITNGFLVSITNINPVTSNLINYGNAIRSEAPGFNSFQAGSNSYAGGNHTAVIGNNSSASNDNTSALGPNILSTAGGSVLVGAVLTNAGLGLNNIVGYSLVVTGELVNLVGNTSYARDSRVSTFIGNDLQLSRVSNSIVIANDIGATDKTKVVAIGVLNNGIASETLSLGYGSGSPYKNSAGIGPPDSAGNYAVSTTTNQIRLGTTIITVSVPGILEAAGISNLTTLPNSTNLYRGDAAFPRSTYTSLSSAGAHNTIAVGTNVWLDASGAAADFPLGGLTGGARDGKWMMIRNVSGYTGDIYSNDGSITAIDRITTLTGTNMTWPNGSFLYVVYDATTSRWLMQIPPMTTITATATNAVTQGENLGLTNATRMGVFYQVQGSTNIQFRTLMAGLNVTITNQGTNIMIAADVPGGSGEANVNGEVSLTNDTMFGLINGKAGITNLLRSIAARNGLVGTNESGTNISLAIDPAIVASQANLTAASNAVVTLMVANDTTTSNGLFSVETTRNAAVSNSVMTEIITASNSMRTIVVAALTNKVENLAGAATNLTVQGLTVNTNLLLSHVTASRAAVFNASKQLTNEPSGVLFNLMGNPNVATQILAGANITVTSNNAGIYTIAGSAGSGSTQMVTAAIGDLTVTNTQTIGFNETPGRLTLIGTNISGAPTNTGIVITNTDPALVGVQKFSPGLWQWGNGWKTTATAASQPIGVQMMLEPVQGTTTPTANYQWRFATNGPPFGATAAMTLSSIGALTVSGNFVNSAASANSIQSGVTGGFIIGSSSNIKLNSSASGVMLVGNSGSTDLNRIQLGGTTLAFPALGRTNGDALFLGADGLFAGGTTNRLKVANGGNTAAAVGGSIYVNANPIASAGAAETNLMSYSLPAHTLSNGTDRVRFYVSGRFAANANAKQIKCIFGSETILDTTSQIVNSGSWTLEGEIIRTGNTAQSAWAKYNGAGLSLFTSANAVELAQTNGIATLLKITSAAIGDGDVTNRTMTINWEPTP